MSTLIKPLFRLMVVTFIFAMLMSVTTTQAGPPDENGCHEHKNDCGGGGDPVPTIEPCEEGHLCIASVGKWHRPPAREYAEQFGVNGNYTTMTSSRFGEILGTLVEGDAATALCDAYQVLIIEWSSPKIKNLNWQRLLDYMECGGGIIFEDPKNVQALAPGVATFELDLHGTGGDPLFVTLEPVCVLTLGPPLNNTSCASEDAFDLEVVNQHIIFDVVSSIDFGPENTFLTLADGSADVVGLYGEFFGGGRIVLTGLDNNYHGNLQHNDATENQYWLLWNEINWLLD